MRKLFALALALAFVAACGGGDDGGEAAPAIVWTAIPDHDSDKLQLKYDPVSKYLEEKTGLEFEYKPATDYPASVSMFKNGDVQLAWFGGLTGVQSHAAVPGARAIVQGEEDPKYKSYFIAHASTGIEKSDEFPMAIADVPFTFGSQSSTSGCLMPQYFIRQNTGKSPDDFFRQGFAFSGKHDLTARQVAEGTKIKAGVLSFTTYDKMVKDGGIDPEVCRVIWVTPEYADYNFTAHPDIDAIHGAGTIDRIQKALLEMDDPKLLGAFHRKKLIEAKNEDFAAIVEVAKQLGMLR